LGIVIIAANAGGAWSPIGDVTTTMLWIGNRITAVNIMTSLILPSLICVVVPTFLAGLKFKGTLVREIFVNGSSLVVRERNIVFFSGIGILILVPVFKSMSGLPPYMGMLLGLALLWIITEIMHRKKEETERERFTVSRAIQRTDVPSVLFFFGILAAIAVLETTGTLKNLAGWLETTIGNMEFTAVLIGLASSVVDNVPLVAATMGMYDYPTDHSFWEFIAYCTGTGGSCLIIGSAAGVAVMGMEDISFGWFLKKISWLALIGYLAGVGVFLLQKLI
ncbi:MAG: SLC13 family permease, partial [Bacteroidia bacterium]